MTLRILISSIALFGTGSLSVAAHPLPTLSWAELAFQLPAGAKSIRYLNGKFTIAGGQPWYIGQSPGSAYIATSSDGLNWDVFSPLDHFDVLSDSTYGNGRYVVTGDDGGVFVSNDGITWTSHRIANTLHDLDTVAFGAGRFVAFARNRNLIYTSLDGETWETADTSNTSFVDRVSFLNDHFVAVGEGGTLLFSADGLTWSEKNVDPTNIISSGKSLFSAEYGKGRYVVGGYFFTAYSTDGETWHPQEAPFQVQSLQYSDGWFVAFGNTPQYMTSRDGAHWSVYPNINNEWDFRATQHNGQWIGVAGSKVYGAVSSSNSHPFTLSLLGTNEVEVFQEVGATYTLWKSFDLTNWSQIDVRSGGGDFFTWPLGIDSAAAVFYRATKD